MTEVIEIVGTILAISASITFITMSCVIWMDILDEIRRRKEKRRFDREWEEERRRVIEFRKEGKL